MKKFIASLFFTVLAACGAPDPYGLLSTPPMAFSAEQRALLGRDMLSTCQLYRRHTYNAEATNQHTYGPKDVRVMEALLRSHGLTNCDLELVRRRKGSWGTGQTWNGLIRSLGYQPSVNRAFYPGIGHQWQARHGSDFIYLRGNGQPRGMRVKAWN